MRQSLTPSISNQWWMLAWMQSWIKYWGYWLFLKTFIVPNLYPRFQSNAFFIYFFLAGMMAETCWTAGADIVGLNGRTELIISLSAVLQVLAGNVAGTWKLSFSSSFLMRHINQAMHVYLAQNDHCRSSMKKSGLFSLPRFSFYSIFYKQLPCIFSQQIFQNCMQCSQLFCWSHNLLKNKVDQKYTKEKEKNKKETEKTQTYSGLLINSYVCVFSWFCRGRTEKKHLKK